MPEFYIRENFKDVPENIFNRVGFSGDHSKTIQLVQSGAYEVGAVNYKVWKNFYTIKNFLITHLEITLSKNFNAFILYK